MPSRLERLGRSEVVPEDDVLELVVREIIDVEPARQVAP
jgi:hypothetical protein